MRGTLTRVLAAITIVAFTVGPVSAATVTSAPAPVAQTAQSGAVTGTIKDSTGAPVANARVDLHGPQSYTTTSDAKGKFSITGVTRGLYSITATRPGYETATDQSFAVLSGENNALSITMSVASFSSLRTIASVRTVGRGTFNQSTASVSSVSAQDFLNQGSPQVTQVLNEIPGLQISLPNNDGNGAVPGAITFPNIRNGLSFETASLIDGHPLSVGKYGDYVTTFLNSFMFSQVEVVKGPGAMSPQTNYAIGGTVNFKTKDPTLTATPEYTYGVNNRGGTFFNFGFSNTVDNGRLGFIADLASVDDPSPIDNESVYFSNIDGGVVSLPGGGTDVLGYNDNKSQIPGTSSYTYNNYNLRVCCYQLNGDYFNLAELFKARYRFSNATTATVSYLGGQTTANQNGNTSELTPSVFQPPAGYTGSVPAGAQFLEANAYPVGSTETNNEPILQAEVSSTIGNDTVLARFYHASIYRLIVEGGQNPNSYTTAYDTLSGVNTATGQAYNDGVLPVHYYGYYRQNEIDKLGGLDFQYSHPYGDVGNSITVTADQTNSQTDTNTYEANAPSAPFTPPVTAALASGAIPQGSNEIFTTLMARFQNNWSSKLSSTLALYDNLYNFTYPDSCTDDNLCQPDGSNATFQSRRSSHFDERLGLTYSVNPNTIVRASAGSAIAPPYIYLLSKLQTAPAFNPNSQTITVTNNNPNLVPETAFGYDLGTDVRVKNDYFISGDVYLTNLFNQFITTISDSGIQCTSALYPTSGCPASGGPEIYYSENTNLQSARYEGIELSLKRVVAQGLGFVLQGSTQRGYAYNLPANFYCTFAVTAKTPCNPKTYNTNLGVVAGQNFSGGSSVTTGGNDVSNQAVPYLQAYAEINYKSPGGIYASFGETLFGKNNSYSEPAFDVARASVRIPINDAISFQVSGYNIFNAYNALFPIVGGGVPIRLANGTLGATVGNVLGPATYNFTLTKTFDK